jgi:O-antigen ligase
MMIAPQYIRRAILWFFVGSLVFLPMELPIAQGVHGIFRPLVGSLYPLLFITSICGIAASLLLLANISRIGEVRREIAKFGMLATPYLLIGVLAVAVTAFIVPENIEYSVRQLAFGYTVPVLVCAGILLLPEEDRRRCWAALYCGWSWFLIVSFFFLAHSYFVALDENTTFANATNAQKLFVWRYTFGESWNLYATYIGNANKTSNYLLIFLLFSLAFIGRERLSSSRALRWLLHLNWILGTFTLLVLFSRAALMLLPFVFVASGYWKLINRKILWSGALTAMILVVVGFAALKDVFAYLLTSRYIDDSSGGALGSFADRFEQWSALGSFLDRQNWAWLYGMGTAGYGMRFFNTPEAGTHNMFLDVLIESGVLGLLLLTLAILLMFALSFDFRKGAIRLHSGLAAFATIVLIMLMFREHSPSYLYTTSLGGFCFTVIFYDIAHRKNSCSP